MLIINIIIDYVIKEEGTLPQIEYIFCKTDETSLIKKKMIIYWCRVFTTYVTY